MTKVAAKALMLLKAVFVMLGLASGQAVAVECDWSPLTRLETAICGEPALRALDRELTATIAKAVLDQTQARKIRNEIARQCRRDASLEMCLISAELDVLERLAAKLGEFRPRHYSPRQHGSVASERADKQQLLQRQLNIARNRLRVTGDPHLTVTTIFALIDLLSQQSSDSANGKRLDGLNTLLVKGCQTKRYAQRWQKEVRKNGMRCEQLAAGTEIYSVSDFD